MKTVNATRTAGLVYLTAFIGLFVTGLTHAANENTTNPTGKIFIAETDGASTIHFDDKILALNPLRHHRQKLIPGCRGEQGTKEVE